MTDFEIIQQSFVKRYNHMECRFKATEEGAEKARQAALRYQRIAARKMGEYYKLNSKAWSERDVHWYELLKEILKEVDKRTGLHFITDDLNSFGLRNETYVFAYSGEPNDHTTVIASLMFTPGDVEKGQIFLDTGENRGNYHPNSIGGMNGFGNVTEEVTSIEVVIENLKRRNPELNL